MSQLDHRSLLTFDLDGVLCRPPFGINPGSKKNSKKLNHNTFSLPGMLWFFERWRYKGRKPMPRAVASLHEFQKVYRCVVVSARSEASRKETEAWLQKYFGQVPEVFLRPSWRETPSVYKDRIIRELQPIAHFEDDPSTAMILSEHASQIFLIAWRRNRGLENDQIRRIDEIGDAKNFLVFL